MTPEAASLLPSVWQELATAPATPDHPWRTPVLVTGGPFPDGRVVVLRRFQRDPDRLTFFTDVRSPKWQALRADPRVTWVFYHPVRRLQVRVRALASLTQDPGLLEADWRSLSEASRREYAAATEPGSPWRGDAGLSEAEAVRNFGVVVSEAQAWDCLQLGRDGHCRVASTGQGIERRVP